MVRHDVEHEQHAARVQRGAQCLEVLGGAEVRVDAVEVRGPVAVVPQEAIGLMN